VKAFEFNCS